MTYYVPQPISAHNTNSVLPSPSMNSSSHLLGQTVHTPNPTNNTNSNNIISGSNSSSNNISHSVSNKTHATTPSQTYNQHGNNTSTNVKTFTPSTPGESKVTSYTGGAQPNVFQYPCAVTTTTTTSSSNQGTTVTSTQSAITPQTQSPLVSSSTRSHFINTPPSSSNESSPVVVAATTPAKPNVYNATQTHPNNLSSHNVNSNTKNNPPLFPTPNVLSNGIASHITNQDGNYHDTSNTSNNNNNGGTNFERKKNQQNTNRKTFTNGNYRTNAVNYNLSVNHQPMSQSTQNSNPRKAPLVQQQSSEAGANHQYSSVGVNQNHSGVRSPSTAYNRTSGNNTHIIVNSVEHTDKRSMNNNAGSVHYNNGGNTSKNTPLIPTLPLTSHNTFDRPRASRPKPLDLRRNTNTSNRNTPSTNSTESNNNSPNSIVSGDQHQTHHSHASQHQQHHYHHHHQQQQPLYISRGAHPSVHSTNPLDACSPLAYNPHSGMYVKLGGQAYITHVSIT